MRNLRLLTAASLLGFGALALGGRAEANPCTSSTTPTVFNFSGQILECVTPAAGMYAVEVYGANGGESIMSGSEPGLGALVNATVRLPVGARLKILVGGAGGVGPAAVTDGFLSSGGGGGGSFVVLKSPTGGADTPLVIAGGGGGGGVYGSNGRRGIGLLGGQPSGGSTGREGGGVGGTGGQGGAAGPRSAGGAGGGGFLGAGTSISASGGGQSFIAGGGGGSSEGTEKFGGYGGYGGGGALGINNTNNLQGSGGGGGWSGGGGGGYRNFPTSGGGGGSYLNPTYGTPYYSCSGCNTVGYLGNGQVIITYLKAGRRPKS